MVGSFFWLYTLLGVGDIVIGSIDNNVQLHTSSSLIQGQL